MVPQHYHLPFIPGHFGLGIITDLIAQNLHWVKKCCNCKRSYCKRSYYFLPSVWKHAVQQVINAHAASLLDVGVLPLHHMQIGNNLDYNLVLASVTVLHLLVKANRVISLYVCSLQAIKFLPFDRIGHHKKQPVKPRGKS